MAVRSWDGIIGVATLKSLIGLRQHDERMLISLFWPLRLCYIPNSVDCGTASEQINGPSTYNKALLRNKIAPVFSMLLTGSLLALVE
jgi:hypothetical protein